MNRTGIQYLDYSWNPIAMRCTPCSPGCANCWHLAMADRLGGNYAVSGRASYEGTEPPALVMTRLYDPLRVKKPATIGVQFMGDLFHEGVDQDVLDTIWGVIRMAHWHQFLVLTKRPVRMRAWIEFGIEYGTDTFQDLFPHVWLGVTVENQQAADERIPLLLRTPAAHRWVSVEPLLGLVSIERYLISCEGCDNQGSTGYITRHDNQLCRACDKQEEGPSIDWIVAGCESGPRRRPTDADWFRSLRDQCQAAGTPYFLKQREIDGKVVHMPELDGAMWDQMPR